MDGTSGKELAEFAHALIHSRQNVSPKRLGAPGPTAPQLHDILGAAAAAPDHGHLLPWRFVVVPQDQRARLAEVFAQALLDRDPHATPAQINNAREKAHRAPFVMLAIARSSAHPEPADAVVGDAERLVSFGCAIQNILLAAHAAGFGSGLTSGQAMGSPRLRALFALHAFEQAVCCINIGTVTQHKPVRLRPAPSAYISYLG